MHDSTRASSDKANSQQETMNIHQEDVARIRKAKQEWEITVDSRSVVCRVIHSLFSYLHVRSGVASKLLFVNATTSSHQSEPAPGRTPR